MLCVVVMEYIPCGELFALWKKLHNFSDSLVQVYVAELGMVLGLCCFVISFFFSYFPAHATLKEIWLVGWSYRLVNYGERLKCHLA